MLYEVITKYKEEKKKSEKKILIDITNSSKSIEQLQDELEKSLNICSSVNMVRDIVNTPPRNNFV